MISDFLEFLQYYGNVTDVNPEPYDDPLIRVEYEAINKDGEIGLATLAPFSHTINLLCYRDKDAEPDYNQKTISEVCRVSTAEVTSWKKESRIPEKYRWLLLLVDISEKMGNIYGHEILHTNASAAAEEICDVFLRMVKCCFDPFCRDDRILAEAVRAGCGIDGAKRALLDVNVEFWSRILKVYSL